MEWTWLKDWWRLKKYRSEHRRRKIKHSHLEDPASSHGHNSASANSCNTSKQYPNGVREHFVNSASFERNDNEIDCEFKKRQIRCLKRLNSKTSIKNKENNLDLGEDDGKGNDGIDVDFNAGKYGYGDDDNDDDDDDEVDDFCYCDECLNVRCYIHILSNFVFLFCFVHCFFSLLLAISHT